MNISDFDISSTWGLSKRGNIPQKNIPEQSFASAVFWPSPFCSNNPVNFCGSRIFLILRDFEKFKK